MGFNFADENRVPRSCAVSLRTGGNCEQWLSRTVTLLLAALLFAPALAAQDFSHPDTEPATQAALIQQANDALAASDFAAALKILTGLNTQLPNNPEVLYDLGLTMEALGPETPLRPRQTPSLPPPSRTTANPLPRIRSFPPRTLRTVCCWPVPGASPTPAANC